MKTVSPIALLFLLFGWSAMGWAQTVDYPVAESTDLIEWEEPWRFWASDAAPPDWPLTQLPETQDVTLLHPEVPASPVNPRDLLSTGRDDEDRVLILRHDFLGLITEGVWWHGYRAPFSAYSELRWLAHQDAWNRARRNFRRRNGQHPVRSQLVYPVGRRPSVMTEEESVVDEDRVEPGLTNLYFVRSFHVDDPDDIDALQIHARFNKGIRVFINGHLVAKARMNGSLTGHGEFGVEMNVPDFVQMDVGTGDWWETQWGGISPDVLVPGENIISVAIHKPETGGTPSMHFDLRLRSWPSTDWVIRPYLHGLTRESVTVSWETTRPTWGRVVIRTPDGTPVSTTEDHFLGIHHEIVVRGLEPDRRYDYVVQSPANPSSDPENNEETVLSSTATSFVTAPEEDSSFSFLFYGDSRWGSRVHRALADLMVADADTYDSRVVMHAGDIVSYGWEWDRWRERFFAPAWPLLARVPIYPSVGNHEHNQMLYYDFFDLPHNESWYHVRYGMADFFALNTNVDYRRGSEQLDWFEAALRESEAPWKIVFFHHPPFACAESRMPGTTRVQEHIVPLLEEYGVDLVLLGHDHLYGRSRSVNGVTYVISGGGGSALYQPAPNDIMEVCERRYHYLRLHVDREEIRWVAIDEDGEIIDEYAIPGDSE